MAVRLLYDVAPKNPDSTHLSHERVPSSQTPVDPKLEDTDQHEQGERVPRRVWRGVGSKDLVGIEAHPVGRGQHRSQRWLAAVNTPSQECT